MAEPIRIVGHTNKDGSTNEGLQAQVDTDGSLRTDLLARYKCVDIDDTSDPQYFGFVDTDGLWYIIQYNVTNGTIRYCKGASGYTLAWANNTTQTYDYYHNIF